MFEDFKKAMAHEFEMSDIGLMAYYLGIEVSTRPDILYGIGLVSRYMEAPTMTHLKTAKRILRYVKGTVDFRLLYSPFKEFKLFGYSNSDWVGNKDDRKSTTGFVFYMGEW